MIGKILKEIICHFPLNTRVTPNQNVFYEGQNIQIHVSPYTSPRNWQIFSINRNSRKHPKVQYMILTISTNHRYLTIHTQSSVTKGIIPYLFYTKDELL